MPDPYTYQAKPTNSVYSYSNLQGKQTYDQFDITYDDSTVFYDSTNASAYTSMAKPTSSTYTYIAKPI